MIKQKWIEDTSLAQELSYCHKMDQDVRGFQYTDEFEVDNSP